jgi:hypothetical protein
VPGRKLESLRRLCALVESERLESPWLIQLQQKLKFPISLRPRG